MMLAELWKGITSNPKLGFEHGNGGWKAPNEQKRIQDDGGKRNLYSPSLEKVLKGLGVLQSGIRAGNNTWPAWAHKRVK
jgi:hypothetical protein